MTSDTFPSKARMNSATDNPVWFILFVVLVGGRKTSLLAESQLWHHPFKAILIVHLTAFFSTVTTCLCIANALFSSGADSDGSKIVIVFVRRSHV